MRCLVIYCGILFLYSVLGGCQDNSEVSSPGNEIPDTEFGNPERVVIQGYAGHAMEPFVSRDGQYLFFNNLNSPAVNTNIHYATRIGDLLFEYQGEIIGVNTDSLEGVPSMDADCNFYFISTRSYFSNLSTIHRGVFADGIVSEVGLVQEIHSSEIGQLIFDVEINTEGNTLYSVDGIYSGNAWPDSADFFIAVKNGAVFERLENSDEIFQNINTNDLEYAACISADGLEFFFTRLVIDGLQFSTYRTTRSNVDEPFGIPERIEAIEGFAEAPALSPDENSLYYHKKIDNLFVIFRVTR